MICVPIVSQTTDEAIAAMHKAAVFADLLEIRVDHIKDPDLEKILAAKLKPIIITIMPKHENGKFEGTEAERIALLQQAIALGTDYLDVNLGCPALDKLIKNKKNTKIIGSYHNFKNTPADLDEIYSSIAASGVDIIKIATFANKLSDNLKILSIVKKSEKKIIAVGMGKQGEISRILAPLYGAYLTFASLAKGQESAPGQITAAALHNIYQIQRIKPGFGIYGIIGNPVSKSKGYLLHNAMFKKYNLNNIYLNFLVDDLEDFVHNFQAMLAGFSVTMPHKQMIMHYLDEIDPAAAQIGAVNTVKNRDGRLIGYNTDMNGAIKAIREKTVIKNRNITILGAGGAARAIAFGLIAKGAKLTILNRTVAKAESLAGELDCDFGSLADFTKIKTDIVINMTAVGMSPHRDKTPINTDHVKNMVVFDAIYNPRKTRLLQEAAKNNCTIISGIEMFINQAAEQFKLWTAIEPDTNFLRAVLQCN